MSLKTAVLSCVVLLPSHSCICFLSWKDLIRQLFYSNRAGDLKTDLRPEEQEVIISKLLEYSEQLCKLLHEPIVDESPEGLLLLGSIGE